MDPSSEGTEGDGALEKGREGWWKMRGDSFGPYEHEDARVTLRLEPEDANDLDSSDSQA